jgi:HSP20 family protein
MQPKKSFFERLTGTVKIEDEIEGEAETDTRANILEETEEDVGQLTVDVYQTPEEIVIRTMVAGVRPEDLDINITRDMVSIKGRREDAVEIHEHDFFHKELYWGAFARTISLPEEIDVEEAEAVERHGLLTIKLPKIDKSRQNKLRVKSV